MKKRKFKIICNIMIIISFLSGCSSETKKVALSDSEGIYIYAIDKFYNIRNEKIDSNGTAYKDNLKYKCEKDFAYPQLYYLYLKDKKFDGNYHHRYLSSGTYEIGNDNEFILSHQQLSVVDTLRNMNLTVSINDEPYEDYSANALMEFMKKANKNNFMTHMAKRFFLSTKEFIHSPYLNEYNEGYCNLLPEYCTTVYLKDKFIVSKQKGYSFDEITNINDFSLKFDDSEINDKYCNMKIKFNSDGTFEIDSCNEYEGFNGTWELLYNHLLILFTPYLGDKGTVSMLYLDFDTKEIYYPIFIREDDFNGDIKKLKDLEEQLKS